MPVLKWHSLDLYKVPCAESASMDSHISSRFSEISQSHAGTLLRQRR